VKFTKQRLSKVADEGRKLFVLESALQRSAALLNLAALGGALYLFAPAFLRDRASLSSQQLIVFSFLIIFLAINCVQFMVTLRLRKKWQLLEHQSTYDGLTKIFNRTCFEEILQEEVRRAGRYRFPLTLCLIDMDNFKTYNDTYGHPKGDALLQQLAALAAGAIRSTDCLARYGGDEFCVLLPHTDLVRAEKFLSRLLTQVQERLDTSFSAGVTSYRPGENKTEFMARVDLALYQAKREGKNRIRCLIDKDDSHVVLSF